MIEMTITEIILLAWAGLATAAWLSARDESRVVKKLMVHFIENKEAREQLLKAHSEFVEHMNRS